MANKIPTAGGTTVSFGNTPQAQDDTLTGYVTEDSTAPVYLDVMGNDLGGAAKSLYSIDDGTVQSGSKIAQGDLLTKDTALATVPTGDTKDHSAHGARIWITADGKVGYDPSTWDAAFKAYVNTLPAGAVEYDTFTYAIQLGNGTLSWATATVVIAGTNDKPTITIDEGADTSVTEAGGIGNADLGDPDAHGKLTIVDVDKGESKFQPPSILDLAGVYGSFTFNDLTGAWTYTLDPGKSDHLKEGDKATDTLTVWSWDGTVSQDITVDITGTNDAPVATADLDSATEDGPVVTGTVATNDIDVDDDAVLTYELDAPVAGLTLNADGSYTFDPANSAYQHLAEGATTDVVAHYTVKDEHGASSTATLTITVTGTNDEPEANPDFLTVDEGDPVVNGNVFANDIDVDDDAVLTYALVGSVDGLTLDSDGKYTFDPSHSAYQYLAEGEKAEVVAHYTVTDNHGATSASTLTITINGIDQGDPNDHDDATATGDNKATQGADTLVGTDGKDEINGLQDNDTIYGKAGDDQLNGNSDADLIFGGSGNDTIHGNEGSDTLYGGSGDDTILGGNDDDTIIGGTGSDTLTGNNEADTFVYLSLQDGNDVITDFKPDKGDKLDIHAILDLPGSTWGGGTLQQAVDDHYVTLSAAAGGGTQVAVDIDGDGAAATATNLAVLENVQFTTVANAVTTLASNVVLDA
jgi:VCBS repeat-containing protein